jgi:HSP20 family protein
MLPKQFYNSNSLLDLLFNEFHDNKSETLFEPYSNIKETDKEYKVELAIPGLEKDDIKITIKKNMLIISSNKQYENKEEDKGYFRKEFNYSKFEQKYKLPIEIKKEDIKANYKNGILYIAIPKSEIEEDKYIEIN